MLNSTGVDRVFIDHFPEAIFITSTSIRLIIISNWLHGGNLTGERKPEETQQERFSDTGNVQPYTTPPETN